MQHFIICHIENCGKNSMFDDVCTDVEAVEGYRQTEVLVLVQVERGRLRVGPLNLPK